jgi:hypothetical protein
MCTGSRVKRMIKGWGGASTDPGTPVHEESPLHTNIYTPHTREGSYIARILFIRIIDGSIYYFLKILARHQNIYRDTTILIVTLKVSWNAL